MSTGADIFLTGATGFSGPAVVAALRESGRSVVALVQRKVKIDGVRTITGLISDVKNLEDEVAASRGIVHLASVRTQDRNIVMREDVYGTSRLIDSWKSGPFIFASSVTVHGIPREKLRETSPIDIIDWYDMAKYTNEFQLRNAVRSEVAGRGAGISLRPTIFLGDNERRNDRQILGMVYQCYKEDLTFAFETEEALETTGVSYVGVEDFGKAVVAALGTNISGPFEVAAGFITWREMVETLARLSGKPAKIEVRPGVIKEPEYNPEQKRVRLPHSRTEQDSSAFMKASGWSPTQEANELIERYVRAETRK
jgi:nucleoside-diphosphate-sugar epimerase